MQPTSQMSYDEKLVYYGTAPRAYTGTITQIVDRDFVTYYVGKLRGKIVGRTDKYKFTDKAAALETARGFREECREEAQQKGLL